MTFDWNPAKDAGNRVKHRLGFETAQLGDEEVIRIISARRADAYERRKYDEAH